ncbi:MAG: LytR family transcriptional regulator, partial [Actinobacteria bacterium]|nr:LytR family transcriptional regulator [Actinomycetota bacterium]
MSPDPEKPPRPGLGVVKRAALASILIILLTASTVASAALLEVKTLVDIVKKEGQAIPGVENALDSVDGGQPQTILVIGSDVRYADRNAKGAARSDTLMLVRLDPDKGATAVLSIPRDLRVQIPGYLPQKINAAYALGGPKLTLETVRQLLGVPINHIVETNFSGFRRAVDRLDCVYIDVDHRYYHSNIGLPPSAQYAEIDIAPGYQKLCGTKALQFARYRHGDSDFVRAARQQEFLRQAKGQISLSSVLGDRQELVRIFARYTRTDMRSNDAILRLLKLGFLASKNPLQEVKFPAQPGVGSDLTISPQAIQAMMEEFSSIRATAGERETGDTSTAGNKARKKLKKKTSPALPPGVIADKTNGEAQAIQAASKTPMPVYFVAARLASGGYASGNPAYKPTRAYKIRDRAGKLHDAYRMVLGTGIAGAYYGVQGTNWKAPPILDSPSERRRMRGRSY